MATAEQRVMEQKIISIDADILDLQVRMVTTEDEVRKLRIKEKELEADNKETKALWGSMYATTTTARA